MFTARYELNPYIKQIAFRLLKVKQTRLPVPDLNSARQVQRRVKIVLD